MTEPAATPPPSCDASRFRVLPVAPDGSLTRGGLPLLDEQGGFCWLFFRNQLV